MKFVMVSVDDIFKEKVRVLTNVQGCNIEATGLFIFDRIKHSGELATRETLLQADIEGKPVIATYYESIFDLVNPKGKGGREVELIYVRKKDGSIDHKFPEAMEIYADGSFYLPFNINSKRSNCINK